MPRYTSAYSGFLRRLEEVKSLHGLAQRISLEPATKGNVDKVNALCRAGVVLLSSHVEGYIEDLAVLALNKIYIKKIAKDKLGDGFRYYLSRKQIREIKDTNTTYPATVAAKVRVLVVEGEDIWSDNKFFLKSLPSDSFVDFSNPKHKIIKKFLARFGFNKFHNDLARRLSINFFTCCNMVDQVVEQRNKIAHGDTTATGTPKDLADMIRLVLMYCRGTDIVVGNWFKNLGCPIR